MSFEDIPEDKCESYPCPVCKNGNVTKESESWECDECDFSWMLNSEEGLSERMDLMHKPAEF